MISGPPFKRDHLTGASIRDVMGEEVELMGSSREILNELATKELWRDTVVSYVSRTEYPSWASACLQLFEVAPGITMHSLGTEQEIYPGSKRTHFRKIHARTGIEYEEMLFFDNESWNISEVSAMGVCSVHCPDGMTHNVWRKGLEAFAVAHRDKKEGKKPNLSIRHASRYW